MRTPLLLLVVLLRAAVAADPPVSVEARELPRVPAVEPARAAQTIAIKPGFHVELVAAEPLVASPIAMSFDEDGRLFVLEMRDYPEQREETPHLGRVRLLTDADGDGRADGASVFAEDLPWPTALIWARGALFVCATPDIWMLQDLDGDGRAEVRRVVFTGFSSGAAKLNVQALANSFAWGPDHRIHLQTGGGNRGVIRCVERPELPTEELAGRDFWFDPRTFEFGFEAGGGQYGMSYDNAGRRFACNNSDHLRTYLFDDRYAARNPFATLPSPLVSVAADGPAAEVFRLSPDEPWRVIRTRWRVAGKVPGVVEGGGRVSGYFTGATGTTVYRGDALGAEFVGNTFTGDAGGNLVHRKRLRADGVSVIGERPADEKRVEFLASRDTWFRPVSFANAPDGTLYIADMYREVIEHPWSIPEQIKQRLDLTSGRERGRIWRVAPDGFTPRAAPALSRATVEELVSLLGHANGWHRDTATRLLCERRDPAAAPLVEKMLREGAAPLGRLHALRVLDGLTALHDTVLIHTLADAEPTVRELAVRLCEKVAREGRLGEPLWEKLRVLLDDPAPRVRLQLAFTAGGCANDGAVPLLAALARREAADRWISAAICTALPRMMRPLFHELSRDASFAAAAAGSDFLAALAASIGARGEAEEVREVFDFAVAGTARVALLGALAEGLARNGQTLEKVDAEQRLPALFTSARETLAAANTTAESRLASVRLLGFDASSEARTALITALLEPASEPITRAAFEALSRRRDEALAKELLSRWDRFAHPVRTEVARFLVAQPASAGALLTRVEERSIPAADIPRSIADQLRQHRDPPLAARAARALPAPPIESRDAVLARLEPSLHLAGVAAQGREIFLQRCASCHRFRGDGSVFGPDLESVAPGGKAKLLTHFIDPNREVAPQFAAYEVELRDGSTLSGVLASETAEAVIVREPLGRETVVARTRLARMQTTGRSPMPEGLEAGLTAQEVAHLLEFLTAPR